jgi:hypothetical protein
MKTTFIRFSGALIASTFVLSAARAQETVDNEEFSVVQAMASIVNRDASRDFDYLYFEADFPASPYVESSLANPDRTDFCGLSREQAQSVVRELRQLSKERVEFDKSIAQAAGMSIGHKRLERFRYLTLSRVVFSPDKRQAWLAVDLNGSRGAIYRMEKQDGEWTRTARCGGWMKTE